MIKYKENASKRLLNELKARTSFRGLYDQNKGSFCIAGNKDCERTETGGDLCIGLDGLLYFTKGFDKCWLRKLTK